MREQAIEVLSLLSYLHFLPPNQLGVDTFIGTMERIVMTQSMKIMEYMTKYGSITPFEAFRDLGITKLATRISEMQREGVKIHKEWETSKNRDGQPVSYKRYRLEEKTWDSLA